MIGCWATAARERTYKTGRTSSKSNFSQLNAIHNLKSPPPPLPPPIPIPQHLHNPHLLPPPIPTGTTKRRLRILLPLRYRRQIDRCINEICKRLAQRRFPLRRREYGGVFFGAPGVGGVAGGEADGGVGEEGEDVVAVG